jgi:tRNA wybutosine-synthesizing protein 4
MQIQATFVVAKYPTGRISRTLQRFGAVSMALPSGVLLIGGVGLEGPLKPNEELVMLRKDDSLVSCAPVLGDSSPPPMFIGHSISKISDQELVMVGGGMVCFSFGTFWNDHIYRLRLNDACENSAGRMWKLLTDPPKEADVKEPQGNISNGSGQTAPVVQVPIHSNVCVSLKGVHIPRLNEPSVIQGSIHRGTVVPFVIESLNLGLCTTVWTKDYLIEKVGSEKLTIIHSASSPHLSFREKNFAYETVPFRTFTNAAAIGSHVYMRALSTSKPSKLPASLANDYPTLATDFQVPEALKFAEQYQHSSVLRISGNVNMWLHYDVMSNILCQVTGSKRVILFPLEDVSHLDFPPGATTSNLDIFRTDAGCFGDCSPMETTLSAGEVLFIPACWPHATAPAIDSGDGGLSVAVNVFFKSFDDKLYAAGRDVYGNRDLEMYQNGRKHVAKIIGLVTGSDGIENITSLAERVRKKERVANDAATALGHKEVNRIIASARDVPDDVARFYLARLADELLVGVEKL